MRFGVVSLASLALSVLATPLPSPRSTALVEGAGQKYVFAHFILGIVETYVQSDWEADMTLAKSMGIDAFALDIGKDSYNEQQLGFAYAAAANVGFKVFISFDFAYWTAGDTSTMSSYMKTYATQPGQFLYNNAAFVSSFVGDGYPYRTLESQSGVKLFACPSWQPGSFINNANTDCGMSWNAAWPNVDNEPIDANGTTSLDHEYITDLGGKPYMMPVSPWFSTHYGGDTYNKNWIFYSDWLYQSRWEQALQLQPQFVEILTWNDFGESHYIGPLHGDNSSLYAGGPTGASRWVNGMPHDAWRDVSQVYIAAFKSGASAPTVTTDELVYYYRPTPKNAACSDTVASQPTGFQDDDDSVFVIAMLKSAGTVTITSGSNGPVQFQLAAGIHTVAAPMGLGTQRFALSSSTANLSGSGGLQITNRCTVFNFNAYVGKVSA
ncbi:glycoside hydrolase family 71 protein [Mycena albidolilacea]|uniref:Glycoside hydrolase family 71 protein n=1 Tax=Mycena albidolilacea TaxID=1033008 RepID=A0AAD7AQ15_9AGAR|nr:glycoside hydrolase family 71 protein [Mycena albidolilacea]